LERDQLLEKLKEFEKIQGRIGQLEAFINQGKLLIGDEPERIDTDKPETKAGRILRRLGEKTNAEKIVEILKVTGRAMTVPEIVNEFKARNWQLGEKNRMQIIRNALKTKQGDLFEKVGIGLWDLFERAV
jgi:hypothetical protein